MCYDDDRDPRATVRDGHCSPATVRMLSCRQTSAESRDHRLCGVRQVDARATASDRDGNRGISPRRSLLGLDAHRHARARMGGASRSARRAVDIDHGRQLHRIATAAAGHGDPVHVARLPSHRLPRSSGGGGACSSGCDIHGDGARMPTPCSTGRCWGRSNHNPTITRRTTSSY